MRSGAWLLRRRWLIRKCWFEEKCSSMRDVSERRESPQALSGKRVASFATRFQCRHGRLLTAGWLILLVGCCLSAWLFSTAAEDTGDVVAYVMVDGQSYPVMASDSKAYRHQIERFGGKMAIFADEFGRWIKRLTTGRWLAALIAVLSVAVAGACFRVARTCTRAAIEKSVASTSNGRGERA